MEALGAIPLNGDELVGKSGWEAPVAAPGETLKEFKAKVNTFLNGRFYVRGQVYVGVKAPNKWFEGYVETAEELEKQAAMHKAQAEAALAKASEAEEKAKALSGKAQDKKKEGK